MFTLPSWPLIASAAITAFLHHHQPPSSLFFIPPLHTPPQIASVLHCAVIASVTCGATLLVLELVPECLVDTQVLVVIGLFLCVLLILLQLLGPNVSLGAPTQSNKQRLVDSDLGPEVATARRGGGYCSVQALEGEVEMGVHALNGKAGREGSAARASSQANAKPFGVGGLGGGAVDGAGDGGGGSPREQLVGEQGVEKGGMAGAGQQVGPPVSKGAAFLRFTLGIPSGVPLLPLFCPWRVRRKQHSAAGGGSAGLSVGSLSGLGDGEQLEQVQGGVGLGGAKKGGRSTLILCIAGCACNCVTSLAWGMLLSWARDLLLIPGEGSVGGFLADLLQSFPFAGWSHSFLGSWHVTRTI